MNYSVIYLNMDIRTDKKKYMEDLFKVNDINDYYRFSAITPNNFNQRTGLNYSINKTDACLISHLLIYKYILENVKTEWTLVCEDDIKLISWDRFLKDEIFSSDYNLIKIGQTINHNKFFEMKNKPKLISYNIKEGGTGAFAYLINKKGCKEICDNFFQNNNLVYNKEKLVEEYKLKSINELVADKIYFLMTKTAALKYPVFVLNPEFDSNIRSVNDNVKNYLNNSLKFAKDLPKLVNSNFLVIFDFVDYKKQRKLHYSLSKGFYYAQSINKFSNGYLLTEGKSEFYNGVNLVGKADLTREFLNTLDYIIAVRDANLPKILEIEKLNQYIREKKVKLIVKSEYAGWVVNNSIKKKIKNWDDFLYNQVDLICVQTQAYKEMLWKELKKTKYDNDKIKSKVIVSNIGVSNEKISSNNNPFDINHNYCVDLFTKLNKDRALIPTCYIPVNLPYSERNINNFNKEKIKLIYMGRLTHMEGKIVTYIHDIMKELQDDNRFELHIFPGKFKIPGCPVKVFSSKYPITLQLLRDSCFYDLDNVIIHHPFEHDKKDDILLNVDVGLDFPSDFSPNIKPNLNCKLFELCRYGIKSVTMNTVNNAYMVENFNNGMVLPYNATPKQYADAIRKVSEMKTNKQDVINKTLNELSWDKICKKLVLDIFEKI